MVSSRKSYFTLKQSTVNLILVFLLFFPCRKSSKKSVSRAAGDSCGEDEGIEEPVTAISGETPPPKPTTPTKKKKKSTKKMTKSEKAVVSGLARYSLNDLGKL